MVQLLFQLTMQEALLEGYILVSQQEMTMEEVCLTLTWDLTQD